MSPTSQKKYGLKIMLKKITKKIFSQKQILFFAKILNKFNRLFVYNMYDSSAYWKARAKDSEQAAVLWTNQEYNNLYREIQRQILTKFFDITNKNLRVLDIGCGIGIVSKMIADIHPTALIDAVDFSEMIEVCKVKNSHQRINYIASSAEDFFIEKKYDIIVSSGCYSAIRNVDKMKSSIENGIKLLAQNGIILMIDPFHRWNYLARVKFSSSDVQRFMNQHKMKLTYKSGVLFWPYREQLANSSLSGEKLKQKFELGEKLLSFFGKHFWADYKILVFKFD